MTDLREPWDRPAIIPITPADAPRRATLASGMWDALERALTDAESGRYADVTAVRRTVHHTAALLRDAGVPHALAAEAIVRRVERHRRHAITPEQIRFWSRPELHAP